MSLYYLSFGSYWRNLSSPLTHWHRGTAFQVDTVKYHPEMLAVHTRLGTDVVMWTMAARITQSIFLLARNLINRRSIGWKMLPEAWKSRLFQTLWWMCWNVIDLLLAVEVTRVYVYKNMSKHTACCCKGQSMNTISIQCRWGCEPEMTEQKMVLKDKRPSLSMETLHEKMDIEADCEQKVFFSMDEDCDQTVSGMNEDCPHKVFSDMDIMVTKDALLSSCTNPLILSMVCVPSEDGESSPSEESSLSESECEDDNSESESGDDQPELDEASSEDKDSVKEDSSLEETSVDSGMQESWTPKSKDEVDHSDDESDWSDEDDSWDEESDADYNQNDDLWASFCRADDPYNPLSFSMPTRSPDHKVTQGREAFDASCEIDESSAKRCSIVENEDCEKVVNCSKKSLAKKPVLSSFKCSHKCASRKEESESPEELREQVNVPVKKVRFSSSVAVHHIVAWNYAYRMARKGPWEEYARDHCRFQKRIAETEAAIGYCLESRHREKIWAALYSN
ncbi:protein phosphatase 1 regulatory subunit 15B-like [Hyperolius riggenbachi]|uniref:protein phosphatase 1 regulatory subunit 15B-like n=1 Tax=Hyperolius riggenbachi TaxID=752182 RepID=UPI0035A26CB2